MKALNCRLGDLAITIKAALPENVGSVVRIVGNKGKGKWWGFKRTTHIWEIEALDGRYLIYEYKDGSREHKTRGLAPDCFLKPIAPLQTIEHDYEEVDSYV
jgi:hypothetical protein